MKARVAASMVAAILWALTPLFEAPAAEKLTAGYSSISPAEWTLLTAAKAKLFERYGLDVGTVYLGGSTRIVQVMIAGDIQIGQIGGSAALFGKAAGIDIAYIATAINSMAAQILSRPEIKAVADLKGKAVGVTRRGANTDYWARFGLTRSGLIPDKDVRIVYTGGLRETHAALQQNQIAAAAMGLGNSFARMLQRDGYNTLIDVSKLGDDFPFNGLATTRKYLQTNRPTVVNFMKAYLEAIRLNLRDKPLSKKILADYTGINDDELLELAYEIYILKIRSRVPYPVEKGWRQLIEFTARDNPRISGIDPKSLLDDSIVRELDENGFTTRLGLR